ncbi:GntR family transcriptional regulator [Sinanaerobacter sp. ZZT-01]|uniref:GntR family transcriptional regulator n=1 Tax=Sinanaerobacter sp. ZZT-01 TaxID=3111540 RepID=UPI002D78B731|nr:GntR family transcriptional regulator [Sinanaerobacter sp. ZZT-01]WRR94830.1 GntR family transcriptional regulator [Sinanaerobacter sp. ZZT-01]
MDSSLRNLATKMILEKIQRGDFAAGDIISESEICKILNISRTPAREALIELVANGVLDKIPRKGYQVVNTSHKQKLDAYIILADLDALAAKQACSMITEQDILHMQELVDLIDIAIKYRNYVSYCELQEKFHQVYIKRADNLLLSRMLDEIKSSVLRYTYFSEDADAQFDICKLMNEEHRKIIQLFQEGDANAVSDYLENTHWATKDYELI